jgi:hypothetical protein
MRTSFHHQPEAQHPKSPAIYTPAGRLPHLSAKSRLMQCSNQDRYSLTSSARASSIGRISRPSAFAVLRLMTRSSDIYSF